MDEPGTKEDRQKWKENLEGIAKGVDDHHLRRELAWLPSASSLAQRLVPLHAIRFLGCASGGKGKLRLAKV
jgi:hypothetical protein